MNIPLSYIGLSKYEKELLATRLYPEANAIFLKKLAEDQGYDPDTIEQLDYSDHPVWKMKKLMRDREFKAKFLQKRIDSGDFDITKFEYPYKTIEEAQEKDKDHKYILMETDESIEDLNERLRKLKLNNNIDFDDLYVEYSSDDEKMPDAPRSNNYIEDKMEI